MTTPIFVQARTPGATDGVEWTAVHRNRRFIWIDHDPYRSTSRWQHVERKRKFSVAFYTHGPVGIRRAQVGYFATLEHARAAATRFLKDISE